MAQLTLPILLLSLLAFTSTVHSATVPKTSKPSSFIKSSCSVTRYPALCINSLASYASTIQQSPKQMAQAALAVSLQRARSAKTYVVQMSRSRGMKKREYLVVRDCMDNMGDTVDRLSQSISELGHMGRSNEDFVWHMSNVQTWVSAALTDENTCVDGFADRALDGQVKMAIRGRITNVARVTSNALALVNRFAERRH
ncbi:hypothetical protein IFM89_034316 [Coptis chinensis]|uniref:Pectinesterase inhibitor domain-containing protein n=1 Tax=Coptis chinensis TaxID=261450 RepID=A0A835IDZ3_9MAGN|nr:hypothetical protein IFM89_034316 [Coptis chinensis]